MTETIDFQLRHTDFETGKYNKLNLILDDVAHFLFDMMFVHKNIVLLLMILLV